MRVIGAQDRTGSLLEQRHFDKHFMHDIQMKGSTGKKIRVFSPRFMPEKVNKMASKVKTLNICALDPK